MKRPTWKIFMDGWTLDYAYTIKEAVEKVKEMIAVTKTTKEMVIYNTETKEQHIYQKLA